MDLKQEGIYDASTLGKGKMLVLGFQHMFAMFGATVLVPILTGLSVSATLLFAGIGTLIFHMFTKFKVPAFLGSSFAFLGGYTAVKGFGVELGMSEPVALTYACIGVFCAGLLYFVLAALFKFYGVQRTMRFFPPVVTGPIIISIGLILSSSAINNCQANWWIALLAIFIIVICNMFGKGMIKIIPIILGVIGSYLVAACFGQVDFTPLREAAWFGVPFQMENTAFAVFRNPDWSFMGTAVFAIVPIAFATMIEHIGDVCAISSTCERNFIADPGLHRTLMGDGCATALAALFGAPANTTYGENTGVLNLTKVFDPKVVRIAACLAILFSFCPKFAALIYAMPTATVGGVSLVLYGMISAVGVRNLVENKVDFTNNRNVLVAALILVLAIGINFGPGSIKFGAEGKIALSGLAVAALVGIILNAVLPGKDFRISYDEYASGKRPGSDSNK
ncbi:MAG: uracil-xanthine permease [Bacteroidaceae bacterium]|nr:uracil-xanthine permease [Bacteroidaceae bacterium]MBP5646462.1 uracil-xanthine permease [Bacteroidaceae bacterium]